MRNTWCCTVASPTAVLHCFPALIQAEYVSLGTKTTKVWCFKARPKLLFIQMFFFTKRKIALSEAQPRFRSHHYSATQAQQGFKQFFLLSAEGPALQRGLHSFMACPWITAPARAAGQTCLYALHPPKHTETVTLCLTSVRPPALWEIFCTRGKE